MGIDGKKENDRVTNKVFSSASTATANVLLNCAHGSAADLAQEDHMKTNLVKLKRSESAILHFSGI